MSDEMIKAVRGYNKMLKRGGTSTEESKEWNEEDANVSDTGSLRYNKGKPQIHQVPSCAIKGMAEVLMYGENKYGKDNWRKGNKFSVPYDSAMRHLMEFWEEGDNDDESKMHHLKHALTNIAMVLYYYENYPEMDDRPRKNNEDK